MDDFYFFENWEATQQEIDLLDLDLDIEDLAVAIVHLGGVVVAQAGIVAAAVPELKNENASHPNNPNG